MLTQAEAAAYHSTKYDLRNGAENTGYRSGNANCCHKYQETVIFLLLVILGGFTFKLFTEIVLLEVCLTYYEYLRYTISTSYSNKPDGSTFYQVSTAVADTISEVFQDQPPHQISIDYQDRPRNFVGSICSN